MKTIIHIGQHKTGTTSIQKYLQDNKELLLKDGLYIPSKIAGYDHPSHFILNVYALKENRYSSKKEHIIAEKGHHYLTKLEIDLRKDIEQIYKDALYNKCNSVLFSNEGLYLLNSISEYKKLINLFSEYSTEIIVVCCFRDVVSYRNSYMKQLNKQNISFSNNSDSYRYMQLDSWLFDYSRKKDLLSKVFDKCLYFSYDSSNNIKKFMNTIGFNSTGTEDYRLNITID